MIRRLALAGLTIAVLSACSQAPGGVDKLTLDNAINDAIGDPGTCVLIGEPGAAKPYQFGKHAACDRALPACREPGTRTAEDLFKATAAGAPLASASCPSQPDGSRIVGWAAGTIKGQALVYAAVMEGSSTPPGLVMADKLEGAFRKAGLQKD